MAYNSAYTGAQIDAAVGAVREKESTWDSAAAKANTALQSFTETDPTVPSWAKQATKPSYTADEVGAAASSHTQEASTITAGTFAGAVAAGSTNQAADTSLLRNSKLVSADTTPTNNGEIFWTYG